MFTVSYSAIKQVSVDVPAEMQWFVTAVTSQMHPGKRLCCGDDGITFRHRRYWPPEDMNSTYRKQRMALDGFSG